MGDSQSSERPEKTHLQASFKNRIYCKIAERLLYKPHPPSAWKISIHVLWWSI